MKDIKTQLKTIPHKPGCYLYYNKYHEIIYVGKAKDLNKRMHSYFRGNLNLKTQKLVNDIASFSYYLTNNELESFILENKLIKKYHPKYNILLKDDKTYPSILLTKEKHPRLIKTRNKKIKGTYYGPFSSASFVNEIIRFINNHCLLRKCHHIPKQKCIYKDLGLCYAPCLNPNINSEPYVNDVKKLFKNNYALLKQLLINKRNEASTQLEFEQAQVYQRLLEQLNEFRIGQIIELTQEKDFLALGYYKTDDWISIIIVDIKQGIISNIKQTIIAYYDNYTDSICSYIYQTYHDLFPIKLYVDDEKLKNLLQTLFNIQPISLLKQEKIQINNFLELNAREYYKNNVEKISKKYFNDHNNGYQALQDLCDIPLEYIEMYDISHTKGCDSVGVRIVYQNGVKNKQLYRKYRLKQEHHGNDYEAMREVLTRRLLKLDDYTPSLIIMDGGYEHVKLCLAVLKTLNLNIKVIGLSKDDKHKTKAIVNHLGMKKILDKRSSLYQFLYKMQEEVHHYAIDYHHKRQTNSLLHSKLDNIKGIGVKRKQLLLQHFDSYQSILNASDQELLQYLPQNVIDNLRKES